MSDEAIEDITTETGNDTTAPAADAEPAKGRCCKGKGGCRCHGHGEAGEAGKRCPIRRCPIKAFACRGGRDGEPIDAIGAAISVAVMAATVVLSVYAQYVLTKWAVKAAVRETGHGRR